MAVKRKNKRSRKTNTKARQKRAFVVSGTRKKVRKNGRKNLRSKLARNGRKQPNTRRTNRKRIAHKANKARAGGNRKARRQSSRLRNATSKARTRARQQRRRESVESLSRQLADARDAIRQRDRLIADISRHPIGPDAVRRGHKAHAIEDASPDSPLPPGAVPIPGYEGAFSMGAYAEGAQWDEIDWSEADWDDYMDDVGPEEEEIDYDSTAK